MSQVGFGNARTFNILKKGFSPFFIATVASGFAWYFASQQISIFNANQSELVRRVEAGQTEQNFKTEFEYHNPERWNCKKINLDGIIGDGRMFIKRNRGKQEGYLVLAPFTVNTVNPDTFFKGSQKNRSHTSHRKFVINLGWIPRSRKHLVYDSIGTGAFGQEVYTDRIEALKQQEQDGLCRDPLRPGLSVRITNISAYVRNKEKEDRFNGLVNWKQENLYKWIDLNLFTRLFRMFNEAEAESVYLERTFKGEEDPESFPIQASKETVIEDLKTESRYYQKNAKRASNAITGVAFGLAAWMTFL